VLKLGKWHGISEKRAAEIIDQARAAVAQWPNHADQIGVSKSSAKRVSEALGRTWEAFDT
jgi:hypothetical protein